MRELENKHIFVSFEPGAMGHKFARVLATMPCMHWYSCEANGINPWNAGKSVQGKYHFDTITPAGKLPPPYDYVRKYFKSEKEYYTDIFDPLFKQNGGEDIINNGKRVIYCTHSMPDRILESFPNSIVFNIVHDAEYSTQHYLDVVSKFPAYVTHTDVVPIDNEYLNFLRLLNDKKPGITLADVWAYETKKKLWDSKYEAQLKRTVSARMHSSAIYRKSIEHNRVMNLSGNVDWKEVKTWLRARIPA